MAAGHRQLDLVRPIVPGGRRVISIIVCSVASVGDYVNITELQGQRLDSRKRLALRVSIRKVKNARGHSAFLPN